MKNFIIDKVEWHTKVIDNTESIICIHTRFETILNFLRKNNLLKNPEKFKNIVIDNETSINSEDLTDLGLLFMKKNYDRWLRSIDTGKTPSNITFLEKGLEKIILKFK